MKTSFLLSSVAHLFQTSVICQKQFAMHDVKPCPGETFGIHLFLFWRCPLFLVKQTHTNHLETHSVCVQIHLGFCSDILMTRCYTLWVHWSTWDHGSWDHTCGAVPRVAPGDHLGCKHVVVSIMWCYLTTLNVHNVSYFSMLKLWSNSRKISLWNQIQQLEFLSL